MVEQHGDDFLEDRPESEKIAHMKVLSRGVLDVDKYEVDDSFKETKDLSAYSVHTIPELVALLESDKNIQIEAKVLALDKKERKLSHVKITRDKFLEHFKFNSGKKSMKESMDSFLTDQHQAGSGLIGDDFVSLLGGPFNKQLYIYDYLKMHGLSFHAQNHDPLIREYINIMRDFTLGRGFRIDFHHKDPQRANLAKAYWAAFDEVNDVREMFDHIAKEICTYGEIMQWWLPNNETKIQWKLLPGQEAPKGIIPRVRLMDPSSIWEVITYPEDITRKLAYVQVMPTQYQMYSAMDKGKPVPSTKFIMQHIPADQVDHYKINSASNEKRGRSDFFPVLGYCKRLRDSVNYKVVGLLKNSAYQMDTEIQGNMDDVNQYLAAQDALGDIPPAGSEFVHTAKVKRQYLAMAGAKGGGDQTFEWVFSMIAAGLGVPVSYFGTHLSGGQTRASALVSTEPVAKKFQQRQLVYERILNKMWKRLAKLNGLDDVDMEVTFPEIIEQDSTQKITDITAVQLSGFISKERASNMIAKELDITDFDYEKEKLDIKNEGSVAPEQSSPLTTPGTTPPSPNGEEPGASSSAITQGMRKQLADNHGF